MQDSAVLPESLVIRGREFVRGGGCQEAPTYAVIPPEVLFDRTLNNCDFRVYSTIVYFRIPKGWTVQIGERRLAKAAGIDRRSLRKSLPKLIAQGHISRTVGAFDEQSVYRITNYLASLQPKIEAKPIAKCALSNAPKSVCLTCCTRVRGLGKSGICRSCRATSKTEKIAERIAHQVFTDRQKKTA